MEYKNNDIFEVDIDLLNGGFDLLKYSEGVNSPHMDFFSDYTILTYIKSSRSTELLMSVNKENNQYKKNQLCPVLRLEIPKDTSYLTLAFNNTELFHRVPDTKKDATVPDKLDVHDAYKSNKFKWIPQKVKLLYPDHYDNVVEERKIFFLVFRNQNSLYHNRSGFIKPEELTETFGPIPISEIKIDFKRNGIEKDIKIDFGGNDNQTDTTISQETISQETIGNRIDDCVYIHRKYLDIYVYNLKILNGLNTRGGKRKRKRKTKRQTKRNFRNKSKKITLSSRS